MPKASHRAGRAILAPSPASAKAQAARMTKAGLMNSDGCRPKIQRFEPFTSTPYLSANRISASDTTNATSPARRT